MIGSAVKSFAGGNSMPGQIIYQVDAFTSRPFSGNPAAVCPLDQPRSEEWMRDVAAEMNLSETAFLLPEGEVYRLRWFTPKAEVTLCGHATLASAHILWEQGALPKGRQAQFETLSGRLTADRNGDWIALNFPARLTQPVEPPPGLFEALGIERAVFVGRYREDYLVEVEDESLVRGLNPNFSSLLGVETRGTVVTARARGGEFDIVSRFFAPAVGVNEDPVTGSAHCALTPYWSAKLGRAELTACQASARGGVLRLRLAGDRVVIEGQAVTVFKAEMFI
jgi:PhzF family phenazine biosynthesis protein